MRNKLQQSLALALLAVSPAVLASPAFVYTAGHGDLAIEFENGVFEALIETDDDAVINGVLTPDAKFEIDDVLLVTGARFTRPGFDLGFFAPLGVANGDSVFYLPQSQSDAAFWGAPWVGIELEADFGALAGNRVQLQLVAVDAPDPGGVFSLWRDGFPPTFFMSTANGIGPEDVLTLLVGHEHYNWGFTHVGLWGITFQAVGTPVGGSQLISDPFTVQVQVVPLPAAAWLMVGGLGALAAVRRRSALKSS
jgi:surface-anchored protein